MANRGLGRDQVHEAAWGNEWYPHPLVSCMLPVAIFLALVALGMFGFTLWQKSLPGSVNIPNVVGMPFEEASARLRNAQLKVEVLKDRKSSETLPEGAVISISPAEGRSVKVGRTVRVLQSSGSMYVKIPDVENLSQEAARNSLTKAGLWINDETYVYDEKMPIDRVISISPKADVKVLRHSMVSLVISKGAEADEEMPYGRNADMRSSVLTIDLPGDETEPAEVRIDVTDDKGTQTVYREEHNPGDTIVYTIEGVGETTAEVFFGSRKILTRKI